MASKKAPQTVSHESRGKKSIKLVQVAGWLGSGKTTFVIKLAKELAEKNSRVAIIVNEIGAIPVDGRIVEEYGLTVSDIGGGCICCQVNGNMLRTVKSLAEGMMPDFVIIEPTGLALPGSIKETIRAGCQEMNILMGPTIVLFDATRMDKLLGYESLRRLIEAQIKDADFIALSKSDMISEETLHEAWSAVHMINAAAHIVCLSTNTGYGVAELVQAAREMRAS